MDHELDYSSLLETLPAEIWSDILSNINKSTDYHRLCTSAPLFPNLLYEQRIVNLFPEVLQILTKFNATKNWKWKSPGEARDTNQFYLNDQVKDLAALRLVCRSWKLGVDRTLQNLPFQFLFRDEQDALKSKFYGELDSYYVTKFGLHRDQIPSFQNRFESTHLNSNVNPFITRKVMIGLPIGGDVNFAEDRNIPVGPLDPLVPLLKKFGEHIWYLEIVSGVKKASDHLHFYTNLKEIQSLMPNVRVVKIDLLFSLDYITFFKQVGYGVTEAQLNQIPKKNEKLSWPVMKNLKFIEQDGMYLPMFLELLKPNLPTLEKLGLTLATMEDLHVLQNTELDIPVTNLRLFANLLNVPWADLFSCVQKRFGKNLAELHLWLGEASPKFDKKDRLKLPNLKALNIKFEKPEPLDFLLDTKNTLETLVVKVKDLKDIKRVKTDECEIKLYRHFKKLHKSNVWNIFPKMLEVSLWGSHCAGTTWSCSKEEWKVWKGNK